MDPYPVSPGSNPGPPTKGPAPESVKTAVKLIWTSVGLSVISTLVTFLYLDEIVDTALEGTGTVDEDAIRVGAIVGAVVGVVIGVGLAALFAYFIGKGANWARIVYTVLTALGILFSLIGLAGSQPALLLVLSLVGLALSVAILFFLYRPDSNAYFSSQPTHGTPAY